MWTLSDLQSMGTRPVSLGVAVGARKPQADKGRRGQHPDRQRKLRLAALCAVSPVCARSIHAAAVPGPPAFSWPRNPPSHRPHCARPFLCGWALGSWPPFGSCDRSCSQQGLEPFSQFSRVSA